MKSSFLPFSVFAQTVSLSGDDAETPRVGKAFLQVHAGKAQPQPTPTPLGLQDQRLYLYLGEASLSLEGCIGQSLHWGNGQYEILQAEPVYWGEAIHHWRAILRPQGEV